MKITLAGSRRYVRFVDENMVAEFIDIFERADEEDVAFNISERMETPYSQTDTQLTLQAIKAFAAADFVKALHVDGALVDAAMEALADAYEKDPSKEHLRDYLAWRLERELGV